MGWATPCQRFFEKKFYFFSEEGYCFLCCPLCRCWVVIDWGERPESNRR